ncbi:hypothetical protein V5N11_008110 [Cardamine amara subsp. amara]|uniref:CAAX prenyl protease 2/Lysostaphin resistance protein A-like domain-containing protein n=1 Tax=Cardamine amara subsp. amara TaxID=228776 RepID=A0ABD1APF6_CARAN
MLTSPCSSSSLLCHRPALSISRSKFRVPCRTVFSPALTHISPLTASPSKSAKHKWKILCFRNEDSAPENPDQFVPEEIVKPDQDYQCTDKKDWKTTLQKASDAVLKAIGTRWKVPWTAETIVQVMLLWVAAFWFIGSWMIPFMAHISGLAGIAILHRCLAMFRPLASDWFRFTLKGNWQLDVIIGCFMFPFVNRLSQLNLSLLPLPPTSSPVSLSSVEQSIMARDPVAMALYAVVVSICAPVWEEIVFRGFLLPSLTRYMPVWCAILLSSVAFALAHFNVQRMLPLVFLGVVLGLIFARSRNLLPSMLLHSLWNGFVFLELMR